MAFYLSYNQIVNTTNNITLIKIFDFICTYAKKTITLCVFLQSKREMIKHDGIIIALNGDGTALVRIVQTSACAACKAKAMCASAESAEKEMTVQLAYSQPLPTGKGENTALQTYAVGDSVEVMVQQKMGWKAVLLAYILPFIVMMIVMVILNDFVKEAIAGTIALCSLGLYFIVLGLFRERIQKEFSFTARKK
jgi:sigma-E factor negative regulatory protein RseC